MFHFVYRPITMVAVFFLLLQLKTSIFIADHRSAMSEVNDEKFLADRGIKRVTDDTKDVYYLTPVPGLRKLYKRDQVETYLRKAHKADRLTDVKASMFSFSRKRSKPEALTVGGAGDVAQPVLQPFLQPALPPAPSLSEATVSRLAKAPGPMVDHRKDLCGAARDLEHIFKKLNFFAKTLITKIQINV